MTANALNRQGAGEWLMPFVMTALERTLNAWRFGRVCIELPSGRRLFYGQTEYPEVAVKIRNSRALWRAALGGSVGWAEAYMAGEWDTADLSAFLTLAARNLHFNEGDKDGTSLVSGFHRLMHALNANTKAGSRRNIAAHYDLGNEFYRLWLDPGMAYSSALFHDHGETLECAQQRKNRRLCEKLGLKPGDHVLEIGCGWGGLAEMAARDYGCRVTALTLSERQAAFARARLEQLGLDQLVDVRLQDYRDVGTKFDAIVSVEMFEAVGAENWPVYFAALRRCLRSGGRAAVQTITIDDDAFDSYRRSADFIQRYIFPGGMLPSPSVFRAHAAAERFAIADEFFFGASYAETIRRWAESFNGSWVSISNLGFDERFRRMWNYYFSYCEAGFATHRIDVGQFLLVNGGDNG